MVGIAEVVAEGGGVSEEEPWITMWMVVVGGNKSRSGNLRFFLERLVGSSGGQKAAFRHGGFANLGSSSSPVR